MSASRKIKAIRTRSSSNASSNDENRQQNVVKCKVKIYKINNNMQRCPYIHEMKERLLGDQVPPVVSETRTLAPVTIMPKKVPTPPPLIMDQQPLLQQQPVATVVKLNPDGYGSHTSPTHIRADRTPLMPKEPEDDYRYGDRSKFPKNAKTSLFIIMSFVYAKLLVVICVAYVISDVVTHNIPLYYYEGFFTYLYGMSILFLLYVFCFLLQESTCCSGGNGAENAPKKVKPPPKQNSKDKEKDKKKEEEKKLKEEKERQKKEKKEKEKKEKEEKDKDKDKKAKKQEKEQTPAAGAVAQPQPPPPPPTAGSQSPQAAGNNVDVEAGTVAKVKRKRKTTQNDQSHGSFFLRIGAIAFGLGTMIYNGLEFGAFFEVPYTSPCYLILRGVNPLLQMIFTFMQMYFIFMNSRLNIHRFKVIARFGLMHVVATNICVWIRTLVLEYLKEITNYYRRTLGNYTLSTQNAPFAASIKSHTLRNANTILGSHVAVPDAVRATTSTVATALRYTTPRPFRNLLGQTMQTTASSLVNAATTLPTTTRSRYVFTTPKTVSTTLWRAFHTDPTTTTTTTTSTFPPTTSTTTTSTAATTLSATTNNFWKAISTLSSSTASSTVSTASTTTSAPHKSFIDFRSFSNFVSNEVARVAEDPEVAQNEFSNNILSNSQENNGTEFIDSIMPEALKLFNFNYLNGTSNRSNDSCGRLNIMGSIVQDSAPYLYPFIIEYSLIGAAVIYVMWKHIGRNPRYVTQEDLEHRLEVMLSRRAVAMAQAQQGRVDCVGASKGLFFGLLMLVASLICLILFFVLIHQPNFNLLAIYLADVSHCFLMILSIIAIIIGFIRMHLLKSSGNNCRVQSLKFKTEEQSDLNDILLRISAFGLFTYAIFSVIAGHLNAFTKEPNLLVMVTGALSVFQVILQLLFIADVSRRRVHLPEHDRSKPGRQVVTFLLICNITMWIIYTFEYQKVEANPVQLEFYGFLAWAIVQRFTLPLCIFHRFHCAVTLAEIWKNTYKARLE